MHHKTLKAAVEKYAPLLKEGNSEEEIKDAIAHDDKGFSAEEVDEIFNALTPEEVTLTTSDGKKTIIREEVKASLNTLYEEWKVKAIVSHKLNQETGDKDRIVKFEKDAQSPIRTTSITADKAEILNSQSENTLLRLYEVK